MSSSQYYQSAVIPGGFYTYYNPGDPGQLTVSQTPLPGTASMMLGALLLVGGSLWYRRKKAGPKLDYLAGLA